ncbi:MAG: GDSL-type esterase/lipase family protein [Planctomycetota bacterium]|nr:GDSL-type esterase/lipase family protein [Planctomycetota bacterium]
MPSKSSRPQKSRVLLMAIVLLLGWGAWRLTEGGAPDFEDLAIRPLPYVNYGWKPNRTRQGELVRSSNSDGFRGPEIERPKPEGRFRIVCLGGSTTYTSFVNDDETYPVLLEAELREARPDLDVEVINAGVESYTSAESLANLAFRCLDFEPDMVVIYHAANDFRPRRYPDFDSAYTPYRKVWDGATDEYVKQGGELGGINGFIQHPPSSGQETPTEQAENASRAGTEAFRRNLVSLIGVARAHEIQPVLVTLAWSDSDCPPGLAAGIREHNEVIREVCAEQQVPCLDFAPLMEQGGELWQDAVHVTPAGAEVKAQLIAQELLGQL